MIAARSRPGFTLIELVVVVAIMLSLFAMGVAFLPGASSMATEARAASLVQGWLNIAKSRAMRDQAPRGVRFWLNASLTSQVTDAEFLEQPDDYAAGYCYTTSDSATAVTFVGTTLVSDNAVQAGDFLEILDTGLMHRIVTVTSDTQVTLASAIPRQINNVATTLPNYRIRRAARLSGDEQLQLPAGVVIDVATNAAHGNALPYGTGSTYFDILFAPSGAVLMPTSTNTLNLWVRQPSDISPTNAFAGDPTIIAVFQRSGFVGAYPPVPNSANPYSLIQ